MTTLHTIAEIMALWTAISCICGLFMGRFIAFGMENVMTAEQLGWLLLAVSIVIIRISFAIGNIGLGVFFAYIAVLMVFGIVGQRVRA